MEIEKLNNLAISESGFIFDPVTGNSYTTNEIGLTILNSVKKGVATVDIARKICEEYDVAFDEIEQDITNMLETFRNNNLV